MSTAAPRQRRRPRIGADSVHAWARNLSLGNPLAKSILMCACHYVNDEGIASMGIATLMQDSDLTENTVRGRLRWLEQIGAIARNPRWIGDNGRINYDGHGKRTSDEIRFLIDADPDDIEAAARGQPERNQGSATVSPSPREGLRNEVSDYSSPSLAPHQPLTCVGGHKELELESNPQSPLPSEAAVDSASAAPAGDGGNVNGAAPEDASPPDGLAMDEPAGDAAAGTGPPAPVVSPQASEAEQRLAKQLAAFRSAYPEVSNRPAQVAEAFAALDDETRRLAVRAAIGASHIRRKQPKKAMVDQLRFLRDPALLAEYARHAPAEVEFVEVPSGTPEWRACALMRAIAGLPVREGQPFGVRAPLPEAAQLDGLDVRWLGDGKGALVPDRTGWVLAEQNSKQFVAWAGLAKRWTGKWPDGERFWLDATGRRCGRAQAATTVQTVGGRRFEIASCVNGLLTPCEWPPRKDGSLATGPPEEADGPPGPFDVARMRIAMGG